MSIDFVKLGQLAALGSYSSIGYRWGKEAAGFPGTDSAGPLYGSYFDENPDAGRYKTKPVTSHEAGDLHPNYMDDHPSAHLLPYKPGPVGNELRTVPNLPMVAPNPQMGGNYGAGGDYEHGGGGGDYSRGGAGGDYGTFGAGGDYGAPNEMDHAALMGGNNIEQPPPMQAPKQLGTIGNPPAPGINPPHPQAAMPKPPVNVPMPAMPKPPMGGGMSHPFNGQFLAPAALHGMPKPGPMPGVTMHGIAGLGNLNK